METGDLWEGPEDIIGDKSGLSPQIYLEVVLGLKSDFLGSSIVSLPFDTVLLFRYVP